MVNTSLQTWIYAEFVFSSYLYVVYYNVIYITIHMQGSYLYILYYVEFICICGVLIKRSIILYMFSRSIAGGWHG